MYKLKGFTIAEAGLLAYMIGCQGRGRAIMRCRARETVKPAEVTSGIVILIAIKVMMLQEALVMQLVRRGTGKGRRRPRAAVGAGPIPSG